ncbi:hypothetical protein LA07_01450, partial [Xanthomonas oryzae pv. oryzae]
VDTLLQRDLQWCFHRRAVIDTVIDLAIQIHRGKALYRYIGAKRLCACLLALAYQPVKVYPTAHDTHECTGPWLPGVIAHLVRSTL